MEKAASATSITSKKVHSRTYGSTPAGKVASKVVTSVKGQISFSNKVLSGPTIIKVGKAPTPKFEVTAPPPPSALTAGA
jgi:hypothetical protein